MSTSSGAAAPRWRSTTSSTASRESSEPVRRPEASGSTSSTPTLVLRFAVPVAVASAKPNWICSETLAASVAESDSVGRLVIANASGATPIDGSNSIVIVVAGMVTPTSNVAPAMPTSSVEMARGAGARRVADKSNVSVPTPLLTAAWTFSNAKPSPSSALTAVASASVSPERAQRVERAERLVQPEQHRRVGAEPGHGLGQLVEQTDPGEVGTGGLDLIDEARGQRVCRTGRACAKDKRRRQRDQQAHRERNAACPQPVPSAAAARERRRKHRHPLFSGPTRLAQRTGVPPRTLVRSCDGATVSTVFANFSGEPSKFSPGNGYKRRDPCLRASLVSPFDRYAHLFPKARGARRIAQRDIPRNLRYWRRTWRRCQPAPEREWGRS